MEKGAEPWGGRSRAAAGSGPKTGGSPSEGPYSEPESGGADGGDEHDVGMRVGAEYQARIPDFEPGATKYTDKDNGGMLVWSPYHNIPDAKLDEYIAIAKEKHGYNVEQARQQTLQLNGSAYSCGLDSLQKIELFVFMTCSACNVHF